MYAQFVICTHKCITSSIPALSLPRAPARTLNRYARVRLSRPILVQILGPQSSQLPYMPFLRKLWRAFPSRTLILAEYRHVTMRLCWSSPHVDEAVYELAGLLEEQGHGQACIMGHS